MPILETITLTWHDLATEIPTERKDVIVKQKGANTVTQRCHYVLASRLDDLSRYSGDYEWAYVREIASVRVEDAFVVKRTDDVYLSEYTASKEKPFEQWSPDIDDALVFPHDRVNEVVAALERYNFTTFRIHSMHKDLRI